MKFLSRKEAKAAGLKHYFTGKPCKRGHAAERAVSNGACAVCGRARAAAWAAKNPERVRESDAAWKKANPEQAREATAAWRKNNPGKNCAYTAKRRSRKLQATPAWADQSAIDEFYKDAARRRLHVDHIIPLQSPIVCGLHVPENLQLLTKSQNSSKGNRFSVDLNPPPQVS